MTVIHVMALTGTLVIRPDYFAALLLNRFPHCGAEIITHKSNITLSSEEKVSVAG